MCRLFGFRSVISSQVHRSLVEAENGIMQQSQIHSDGWGVAYYVANAPHLIKSTSPAMEDRLFQKISGLVASEAVVAHIRKATQGQSCVTNIHPFQYGRWIFAHNGNIENFAQHREQLTSRICTYLRRFILGSTDSEVIFYLILSHLSRRIELHRSGCALPDLAEAVADAMSEITGIVGPWHGDNDGPPTKTYLTFIISDGACMLAHQGGKTLYYSTYKKQCSERDACPHFAAECENPATKGYVNHLVFSSEKIQGENIWIRLQPGQMIGVDWHMRLRFFDLTQEARHAQ